MNAPEGKLIIANNHNTNQYYQSFDDKSKNRKYLSKKDINYISKLAQKEYAYEVIDLLKNKLGLITEINEKIEEYNQSEGFDSVIFENLKANKKVLILPYYLPDEDYIKQWESEEYVKKEINDDSIQYTNKNEKVRSKSEKTIADLLYRLGLPYKYEKPIFVRGWGTIHPDFTILDVKNRREVILEHFGIMDNFQYCENVMKKIKMYSMEGFVFGQDILYTFETYRNPLDSRVVEKMLRDRFDLK